MELNTTKKTHYEDYARNVEQLLNKDDSRSIRETVAEVFDWCLAKGRTKEEDRDRWCEGVRKAHRSYRDRLRADGRHELHGNSALSVDEEDILIGFLRGKARGGLKVTVSCIRNTALTIFGDKGKFGDEWYPCDSVFLCEEPTFMSQL